MLEMRALRAALFPHAEGLHTAADVPCEGICNAWTRIP